MSVLSLFSKCRGWSLCAVLALACAPGSAHAQAAQKADLLITHATIVDAAHARTVADQAVVIRGDDIVAVGATDDVASDWSATRVLDARGRFLMPGLWDMHVHFGGQGLIPENKALMPLYVANGVTTVRDCSGDLAPAVLSWRGDIASGKLFGPRLFSSGAKIEGIDPSWTGTLEVGSKADVDAALDKLQADHVDFVKITNSSLKPELFLYAVSQASKRGMRISAHIPLGLTVEQAVKAGLTSIEHIGYAYKMGAEHEAAIVADYRAGRITSTEARQRLAADFDPATAMKAYRWLAAHDVYVTPTAYEGTVFAHLDTDTHRDDPELAYIGPGMRETWTWRVARAARDNAAEVAARHRHVQDELKVLPMLQKAGVRILVGTDAGFLNSFIYPGFSLHDEMETYVEAGLTPAQVLAAATRNGPRFFGKLDRYGSVAVGKAADLLLLARNPLEDVSATRDIDAIVMRGKLYDRAQIKSMLRDVRQQVATWDADVKAHRSQIALWKTENHAAAIGKAERYAADARERKAAEHP
ncbi:MAG TPA: amidohydrolase family protein [Oleiagrimonas sp.]|nr:amidohydrolase family protein [Oleiagrimonas sp.]